VPQWIARDDTRHVQQRAPNYAAPARRFANRRRARHATSTLDASDHSEFRMIGSPRSRPTLSCTIRSRWLAIAVALSFALPAYADVKLASVFQSDMVLQRDIPCPIWGTANPNEAINVALDDTAPLITSADAQGNWSVKLPPTPAGGPHTLTVSGNNTLKLDNLLMGDVWICSGQSNMEIGVRECNNGPAEVAAANYPNLRLCVVRHNVKFHPAADAEIRWSVCTPDNLMHIVGWHGVGDTGWGGFSAVAYYFGRDLQNAISTNGATIPIGLIQNPWSAMPIQPFISADSLKQLPNYVPIIEKLKTPPDDAAANPADELHEWFIKNDPIGSAGPLPYTKADFDDATWKSMKLPQNWEKVRLGDVDNYDGIVWFRLKVTVPATWAGHALKLSLGQIDDMDVTFFNGTAIGSNRTWDVARSYKVPAEIAVRVLDTGGTGGFLGNAPMTLALADTDTRTATPPIPLNTEWKYLPIIELSKASPVPSLMNETTPTVLYNGMVNPLVPMGIKGAIWYQGESNAGAATEYRTLLPMLISDWRSKFGVGDFPFYIVQLASYMEKDKTPKDSPWAELRDAQLYTSKTVSNSGIAVTTDIGAARDIHPRDKQDVGHRLALVALHGAYGQDIEYAGPMYTMMTLDGDKAHLFFSHADGLTIKSIDHQLHGFAIAGDDGKFVWADATIDAEHNSVIVSSPTVSSPTAVRYDWGNNPDATLFNSAGLPASPFRTDQPAETK
jgi:sialate O-acetylesterase